MLWSSARWSTGDSCTSRLPEPGSEPEQGLDHLRDAVWGHSAEVLSRTLDTHISRLRQLLNLRPGQSYTISAIYGYGYRLDARDAPVTQPSPA